MLHYYYEKHCCSKQWGHMILRNEELVTRTWNNTDNNNSFSRRLSQFLRVLLFVIMKNVVFESGGPYTLLRNPISISSALNDTKNITQCWQKTNSILFIFVLLKGVQMADTRKIINLNVFHLLIIYFLEKLFQITYLMIKNKYLLYFKILNLWKFIYQNFY